MSLTDQAQQFQRAVRNRPFTAQYVFGADGDPLPDLSTPVTVTITDASGATVATGTAGLTAASASAPQTATFALAANLLPNRDLFTCAWAATINAATVTSVSTIDVCDSRLFTLSVYSQYPEIAQRGFTDQQLETQRMAAEDFLERECGRAFTGRYGSEIRVIGTSSPSYRGWWGSPIGSGFRTRGIGKLVLHQPYVQVLRGITRAWVDNNGNPQTHVISLDWAELDPFASAVIYHTDRATNEWDGLWGDLTISYEHGAPLADAGRVCAILARHRLLKGPLDDRATQLAVEGAGTINLLTPGIQGSVTGIAEVDVFIQRYNARSVGFIGAA
jgi:hypothetical protein